jgi:hypothetical protein
VSSLVISIHSVYVSSSHISYSCRYPPLLCVAATQKCYKIIFNLYTNRERVVVIVVVADSMIVNEEVEYLILYLLFYAAGACVIVIESHSCTIHNLRDMTFRKLHCFFMITLLIIICFHSLWILLPEYRWVDT